MQNARSVVSALGHGFEVLTAHFDEAGHEVIALPALALVADWHEDCGCDVTAFAVDGTPSGGYFGAMRMPDGRVVDGESTVHRDADAWLEWLIADRARREVLR